ncbi:hypothetical protein BDN72DRAFT_847576 [Pluteus cervinus]|uniref:Uncharacterized protein n=1 Tax=Pluteus cervinus TaxID=181527 RepID=A0ACD3AD58_9AGAR|nr:hypothetical protein BDN72DRAFT_847576 [Pluteus cervinus]
MSTTVSPRLPPELEHFIFLIALKADYREARSLLLVAKRVFNWLIPHVFGVVEFSNSRSLPIAFNETIYKRYGCHVHDLHLETKQMACHLPLFPNIVNLTLRSQGAATSYLPALLDLPLERLSITLNFDPPSPELFQVFSKVAHLDLLTTLLSWSSFLPTVEELLHLPKLTHLSVPWTFEPSVLMLFLDRRRCPELRVAIVWGGRAPPGVDDPRVCLSKSHPMKKRNWDAGEREMDMWECAGGVIAE